jgi:hypothetical protein
LPKSGIIRRHQVPILKAVALTTFLILIVLGSTFLVVNVLRSSQQPPPSTGWQNTSEIRIVMDSTADWARIMFNDLTGTNQNGLQIVRFDSRGWLLGNDSDDAIDAGSGLTFIDVLYNTTVTRSGDIVGFFKGNNDFSHTIMYADVVLKVDRDMRQVYMVLMLAGAGTTTFELISKDTGVMIWQDTETGNSYTQYIKRMVPEEAFFAKQEVESILVVVLAAATIVTIAILTTLSFRAKAPRVRDSDGL